MIQPFPQRVLFLVGPTASGKSRLSLDIAEWIDIEIVSADSRQVYRTMDIGTAKPFREELERIPHHLIDTCMPDEAFSAGAYGRLAREAIASILARGKTPVVVGGSGLYLRAVADGVFEGPFRDDAVRERLNAEAEREGTESLYERLSKIDPDAAARIHPNDRKRLVRALEVFELSRQPITYIQKTRTAPGDFEARFYGLDWPRVQLCRRIEERVDRMVQSGLVREVQILKEKGFGPELNALDSVGYKEVFQFLEGGMSFGEMVLLIKQRTRRFAKRQMTWFRQDERIQWIPLEEPVNWKDLAERVVRDFQSR